MSITPNSGFRQLGLTLIELMISITLGLFVLSGLVYLTSSTINSNTQQLKTTRLNQELRALMHLVTRDMRRAGGMSYAADAIGFSTNHSLTLSTTSGNGISVTASSSAEFDSWVGAGVIIKAAQYDIVTGVEKNSCLQITSRASDTQLLGNNVACPGESTTNAFLSTTLNANSWIFENAFSTASYILTDAAPANVVDDAVNTTYNCMIIGYDKDGDSVADADENFGFRLDAAQNALETHDFGTVACDDGTWENISDEESINITAFTITKLTEADSPLLEFRIALSGNLKSDPSVSRTIEEVVKLRNDPVL